MSASNSSSDLTREAGGRHQRAGHGYVAAIAVCFASLQNAIFSSAFGILLPTLAKSKDVPSSLYGIFLSASSFAQVVFAPICGFFILSSGAHRCYKIGFIAFVLFASCNASLQLIPANIWFAVAFTIRLLSSFGSALMATSGLVILLMSEKEALYFSWVEFSFGLGSVLGTFTGSNSSEYFEFYAVILSITFLGLILWITARSILPKGADLQERNSIIPYKNLLSSSEVGVNLLVAFIGTATVGFADVTLYSHLEQLDLTGANARLLSYGNSIAFAVFSLIWGFLCNGSSLKNKYIPMIASLAMTAIAFTISGPMYPFPAKQSIDLIVTRQLLLGAAAGAQSIIPLTCGLNELRNAGVTDCIAAFSKYTSLFWAALQLGFGIGPMIGQLLQNSFGYEKASLVMFVAHIATIGMIIMFLRNRIN